MKSKYHSDDAMNHQGKKGYRLSARIIGFKPASRPLPNYWDENLTVEELKALDDVLDGFGMRHRV